MPIDYKSWYESAKAELQRVEQEKAELERALAANDRQIAALIQTMNAIAPLVGEELRATPESDETPPIGMTDCVRTILGQAGEPLSAAEVRDRLEGVGFDMKSYSNPLATVHTILRRLTESEEAEAYYEGDSAPGGGKKFTMALTKGLAVDKIAGKSFEIGKLKGFIGVGRLKRRSKAAPGKPDSEAQDRLRRDS